MCDDCQAYMHFLQRPELLDVHGGTEIIQLPPAHVTVTEGREQVRCVRLYPKGMMRWYAGCCNTPIGNTLASPKVPFAGILAAFVDPADNAQRDRALGPIILRAFAKFAIGQPPAGSHPKAPLGYLWRTLGLLARAWLAGKHSPSPFFDATGTPVVEAQVLSREQRQQLGGTMAKA
jgi:hypothetical protein